MSVLARFCSWRTEIDKIGSSDLSCDRPLVKENTYLSVSADRPLEIGDSNENL